MVQMSSVVIHGSVEYIFQIYYRENLIRVYAQLYEQETDSVDIGLYVLSCMKLGA